MYNVTPYAFSGLLAGISSVAFGIFVYLKTPNRRVGRIWGLVTFSVAGYGFGILWGGSAQNPSEALLAWRLAYAFGVLWIVSLLHHFVCVFCEIERPRSVLIHYLISFTFLLTLPTSWFWRGVRWDFNSFYYVTAGPLYPFFLVWWLGLVVYNHYILIRCYNRVPSHKKQQIKYFFLATAVGFAGGSCSYFPPFGIDLYPWGNFTVFLYPFIMSYAILKHNLMEITVVIRKTLIYSLVMGVLTAVYLTIAFLVTHLIGGWMGPHVAFSYGIAASIVAVLFDPLRNRIQRFVDQRFFRDSINREEKLLELSNDIVRQKNPNQFAASLLHVLKEALHPKQTALYLRSETGNAFQRMSPDNWLDPQMPEDSIWASYFNHDSFPIIQSRFADYANHPRQPLMEALVQEMKNKQIEAALSLGSTGNALGYLFLGEKKSEGLYTSDDLSMVRNALNQTTLAYERYLLDRGLQEAPQALGTMASSFVHEIKTPMVNIKLPADLLLLYLKDVKSGKRQWEDVLPVLEKHLRYIQEQSVTAVDKIDAIRQMSKRQPDSFKPLSLSELIKSSLSTLDQLIAHSGVQLTVILSENLPLIQGNAQQLGIVFMNLVKNGIEAMVNDKACSRPKTLRVEAHEEDESIVITVEDAGPGIEPENINRLFQAYFSTKGSQGTGMGLFLAQEVIKAHGGNIDIKSEVGKGTAFIVQLPKYTQQEKLA